jgi:hypothetical protein
MRLTSHETLRALMTQHDVSYTDLALAADVSKGFISHLVKERKKTCTPAVADRIARRLFVPLGVLFVASASISTSGSDKRQKVAA